MHDGDKIVVDAQTRTIEWLVDEETKSQRRKEWEAMEHPLKVKRGVLLRYARDVAVSATLICGFLADRRLKPANVGAYCN